MADLTGGQVSGGTPDQWKTAFSVEFEKYKKAVRLLNYEPK
jgi:hypothetical protein